jgi:hypothetical protein
MRLPWVSRDLYEQSQGQVAELKEERKLLLNRLAEKAGMRALFPEEDRVDVLTLKAQEPIEVVMSETAKEPERAKATIDGVEAWANSWARQRALRG